MFDFLSWGHLLVIGLAAFLIFGPERLPTLARDAARGLRGARQAITAVRDQLGDEFGDDLPGLRELDLSRYHPRSLVREHLLGEDRPDSPAGGRATTTVTAGPPASAADRPAEGAPAWVAPRREGALPPPFDIDAT